MSTRATIPWSLALATVAACSSDGTPDPALVDRYCDGFCTKAAECSLFPGTKDSCVTTCKASANGGSSSGGSTCNPTSGQIDACLSDLTAASCASLESGIPASCEAICPEPDGGTPLPDAAADARCTSLAACCPSVPEAGGLRDSCWQTSTRNFGSVCGTFLTNFEVAGYCGGGADAGSGADATPQTDASPSTDATPATDGGRDGGVAPDAAGPAECRLLATCCPTLEPAAQPGCEQTVSFGNAVACAAAYGAFCSGSDAGTAFDAGTGEDAEAPVDSGPPDAGFVSEPSCVELLARCPTLPNNPLKEVCAVTATSNFEVACAQGLTNFRQGGHCGAGDAGPTRDAGPGCELLAACCPSVDPSLQSACTSIVGVGDVQICLDTLASFQANGDCL